MLFQRTNKAIVLRDILVVACVLVSTRMVAYAQPSDTQTKLDYRIRIDDLLEIQIDDVPELSGNYPVQPDGTFTMPFLGRTDAHLRTTGELAKTIEDSLRGRYIKDPKVRVGIKQGADEPQASKRAVEVFYVAGEVRAPGFFALKGRTTLLQAIASAQGRTSMASDEVAIFRSDPSTGKRSEIRLDIVAITKSKKKDIVLQSGDIVVVPNPRKKRIGEALRRAFPKDA